MNPRPIELSTEGDLYVYELMHPSDHTKNGQVRTFRNEDRDNADRRATALAKREGCTVKRKAVL